MAVATGAIDPTLIVATVGQIVTWIVVFGAWRRRGLKDAAAVSAEKVTELLDIKSLTDTQARLAKALDGITAWQREHERGCDRRWAATDEILKQHSQSSSAMAQMLEGLQRQITNVALGLAPAPAAELPALPRQPRRPR